MNKFLRISILLLCFTACKREIVPLPLPLPDVTPTDPPPIGEIHDSISCAPFLERILINYNISHADSAILQVPCQHTAADSMKKYPLLVFFNGVYEGSKYGTLRKMMQLGPPKYMADSLRFSFKTGDKTENMIVVCPQSFAGYRMPVTTNQIIDYMIEKYPVDTTRIYLAGLSAGATSLFQYLTYDQAYANRIAAAVPMSTTGIEKKYKDQLHYINNADVKMLIYCGREDTKFLRFSKEYAEIINQKTPGLAKFSLFNSGHKNWNPLYDLTNKYYTPNIYEWMLQYSNQQ